MIELRRVGERCYFNRIASSSSHKAFPLVKSALLGLPSDEVHHMMIFQGHVSAILLLQIDRNSRDQPG